MQQVGVALGDVGGGILRHQTMRLGSLAALGFSIFISDSSNAKRRGNISSNFLLCFFLFIEVRGQEKKKEQQRLFMPLS